MPEHTDIMQRKIQEAKEIDKAVSKKRRKEKKVQLELSDAEADWLRNSFMKVYYEIGGDTALTIWAERNRKEFYKYLTKLLPSLNKVDSEVNVKGKAIAFIVPGKE